MSAHTPGPWFAVGSWVEHADDDVADICNCDPASMEQGHLNRSYNEVVANAMLIAEAPELLACLIDVLDADGDLYAMDFDRYRAAISKATGGAA